MGKDDEFNGRKGDAGDSRYAEAISRLEKELAEKGLSRDEIKSLEEVIYGQADEILEDPASGKGGGVMTGGSPDARIPRRRDADFLDDILRETKGNSFSKGEEETDMEKPTVKEGDRIYDLTDVVEEPLGDDRVELRAARAPLVKDHLAAEAPEGIRVSQDKKVYELSNLFDEGQEGLIREEIRRKSAEIAERVAREVMPGIVERVIREEIDKLKKA